jgi:carbon monoxide dehydrogenase subunit G
VKLDESVLVPALTEQVRPHVEDLALYNAWMPLVHGVERVDSTTWNVELRAKVGPFARSKRLRMTKTVDEPSRIVFERREVDGKSHAPWLLSVTLQPRGNETLVSVQLEYQGTLWTGGLLDKVLRDHIAVAKELLPRVCLQ